MLVGSKENKGCTDRLVVRAAGVCGRKKEEEAALLCPGTENLPPGAKGIGRSRQERRHETVHVVCACGLLPQNSLARAWSDPRDDITCLQRLSERCWGTRQVHAVWS